MLDWGNLANPSYGNILDARAAQSPDEAFLFFADAAVTYRDFVGHANRAANGFLEIGVRRGDKVAVLLPNCLEWLYCWFGLAKIGAVFVPVAPVLDGRILAHVLNDCGAIALVIDQAYVPKLERIEGQVGKVKKVVVHDHGMNLSPDPSPTRGGELESPPSRFGKGAGGLGSPAVFSSHDLFSTSDHLPAVDVRYPDLSHIVYTSGTTGFPKGVVFRHPEPGRKSPRKTTSGLDLQPGEVRYFPYPLHTWFHMFVSSFCADLKLAFNAYESHGFERTVATLWDNCRRYNAACFLYFRDLLPTLMSQPPRADDRQHRVRFCHGIQAPTDVAFAPAFERRFGVRVIEMYATTEAGVIAANFSGKAGSMGKCVSRMEAKIVDARGRELQVGEVGEILLKRSNGSQIEVEYYGREAASPDWYHTGDMGYKDSEGYIYFVDRKLDLIKHGNMYVPASEIERVAGLHPAVAECVAVGVPKSVEEDAVKLFVILKAGISVEPGELRGFCEERLPASHVPEQIDIRQEFPRNSRGKVERYKLRDGVQS